jgi:hypothetical protein
MISGVLSEKTGRLGFNTLAAWSAFAKEEPVKAGELEDAFKLLNKHDPLCDQKLKEHGVRNANIIIHPGKVRAGEGRRGGTEGREGGVFFKCMFFCFENLLDDDAFF